MSIQPPPTAATAVPGDPTGQSEDCLVLNMWAPWPPSDPLPVMVFLHGGGFVGGNSASRLYDGTALASAGVVLVTVNYRLGALGWLAHPDFDDGEEGSAPGNFGLHDQLAALEWLQRNVSVFGGDAKNVTLFGESAGAMSTGALLASDAAGRLFHRTVLQSGAPTAMGGAAAESVAVRFFEALGIDRLDRSHLEGLSTEDILRAQSAVRDSGANGGLAFQPVVDGDLLPAHPASLIAAHGAGGVDIVAGTNRDEWRFWSLRDASLRELGEAALLAYVRRHLEAAGIGTALSAEQLIETFRAERQQRGEATTTSDLHTAISTDWVFRVPAMRLAEAVARHGSTAYAYLFDWESPFGGGSLGACHGLELPFVFGSYGHPLIAMFAGSGPEAEQLSGDMVSAWVAFAGSGRPAFASGPDWAPYSPPLRTTMRLGRARELLEAPMEAERAELDAAFGPYGEMETRLAEPWDAARLQAPPRVP